MPLRSAVRSHIVQRGLAVIALAAGISGPAQALVSIGLDRPGLAVEQGQLLIALPIKNGGDTTAIDVRVVSAQIAGARIVTRMAPFIALGDVPPEERAILNLQAVAGRLDPAASYGLRVEGLYSDPSHARDPKNQRPFHFQTTVTVPRAAPGSALANSINLVTQVTNGPYPPIPTTPNVEGENEDGPPTPIGPLRAPFVTTPTGTAPACRTPTRCSRSRWAPVSACARPASCSTVASSTTTPPARTW